MVSPMSMPIETLTPRQIVAELDKYIVGQSAAKKAVAVALRNRFRRQMLPLEERRDVLPKNILMMGPTGVGKTEIARRLAQLARAPFVKVEATKFTEVGYVGRDVEAMVRDLVAAAYRIVEQEKVVAVREEARQYALETVAEALFQVLHPEVVSAMYGMGSEDAGVEDPYAFKEERVQSLKQEIEEGQHASTLVSISVEESGSNFLQVFTPGGMEEMGLDMGALNPALNQTRHSTQEVPVDMALKILEDQEGRGLVAKQAIGREAIDRAQQTGIIFIDEIDKVGGKSGGSGPDVSREGVQRDLLPIIEGCTVPTKYGPCETDHILFIAAGAFHISKPSDLIPELQGRLPIRVELTDLAEEDFKRILTEPKNALTKQYAKLLLVDGITIEFSDEALDEVAHFAFEVNSKVENIGARRLHTILEKLLEEIAFEAPEVEEKYILFDVARVREVLGPLVRDIGSSRTML